MDKFTRCIPFVSSKRARLKLESPLDSTDQFDRRYCVRVSIRQILIRAHNDPTFIVHQIRNPVGEMGLRKVSLSRYAGIRINTQTGEFYCDPLTLCRIISLGLPWLIFIVFVLPHHRIFILYLLDVLLWPERYDNRFERFERRIRLYQRTVHRQVLAGYQPLFDALLDNLVENGW